MGLISRLFGKSDSSGGYKNPKHCIEEVFNGLIEKAGLDLSFDIEKDKEQEVETYKVNLYGTDEQMLINKDGMLLEAFQLFIKRVLQHNFAETPVNILCDSNNFRSEENATLEGMIEKLKEKALAQGRPVYVKALPPKERRVVHQFLAKDDRVKSKSIGDGHFKKIKIFAVNAPRPTE